MSNANSTLYAISPVDGRYHSKTVDLSPYLSEFGLIKYRVQIEVEYLIELARTGISALNDLLDKQKQEQLRAIYLNFDAGDAQKIKDTEKVTNHDVKAVEYFVKDGLRELGMEDILEFVHFGLTSQDINNTAIPLSLKEASDNVLMPSIVQMMGKLESLADEWAEIPMLARTHGQAASPTRLGKELNVFIVRMKEQIRQYNAVPWPAKFGGATGNFNAHLVAYEEIDWYDFSNAFIDRLGMNRSHPTTQIEHYDNLAARFDALRRFNVICIDMCRDIWTYVSMDYFKQKIKENEVGSSAMPHKVNPIDFENAEGNLGVANALLDHLSGKLPISRLQRDLTDSTVLRNVGVPLGHMMIALASMQKGLGKLVLNADAIAKDLEKNWAVVAEAIQTILRREQYPNPYETLKALTRTHQQMSESVIAQFIDSLEINDELKQELKAIRPENYTGI